MLVYQKTTFDRYYCIKPICHLKTLENTSKSSFLYYYNGAQKHEGFVGFEKHMFQSNDLCNFNVTKLHSFLCTIRESNHGSGCM